MCHVCLHVPTWLYVSVPRGARVAHMWCTRDAHMTPVISVKCPFKGKLSIEVAALFICKNLCKCFYAFDVTQHGAFDFCDIIDVIDLHC